MSPEECVISAGYAKWGAGEDRGGIPQPGLYSMRLTKGGHHVNAAIERVSDGTWRAVIDGHASPPVIDPESCDQIMRVWHSAPRSTAEEHRHRTDLKAWALRHQPLHPILHPPQPIRTDRLPPVIPQQRAFT